MEHDLVIFGIKEINNFDPSTIFGYCYKYTPGTGFVVQGHVSMTSNF